MYKDELKKIDYYKEQLMQTIAQSGVYPSPSAIQNRLDDIDTSLSVFRFNLIGTGDLFSVDTYDTELTNIWRDLYILYKCVYEVSVQDYQELKEEIDRQLQDIETMARTYYQRGLMETTNTFGATIYFAASGIIQNYLNGQITISLGTIKTHEGASLACILEGTDIVYENVYFQLGDKRVTAYGYNQDLYTVPGEPDRKTYEYTLDAAKKAYTFSFLLDSFTPSVDNAYTVLAGKNMVAAKSNNTVAYVSKSPQAPVLINQDSEVTFYVYQATYIAFEYSQAPELTNFTGNEIRNPDHIQKVVLTVRNGTVLNFKTDGTVYAEEIAPYISNGLLCCYRKDGIQDYFLEETYEADEVTIPGVSVVITDADRQAYEITSIAIKESREVVL